MSNLTGTISGEDGFRTFIESDKSSSSRSHWLMVTHNGYQYSSIGVTCLGELRQIRDVIDKYIRENESE